ncbi:MAG: aspartyl/asparaginyl beta-hydroxylase domain-containing protein [Candidatus Nanopelagicales bacterium]
MSHYRMQILEETGYVVLDRYGEPIDPQEWMSLEYVDWKSSGDTRFAPLASAYGDIECNGFWHFDPPKADKDGVWIDSQVAKAPTLVARAQEVGANVGRCRIIELQPNSYADALYNSHLDDNNRLNPDGEGWVVRCFMQLTDNPDTYMVLREDIDDPSTETRIALPAGAQLVVDSERMWHSVWHTGDEPRYCLITSFESGPALEKWIFENNPVTHVDSPELDADYAEAQREEGMSRRAARTAYYGYDPTRVMKDEA